MPSKRAKGDRLLEDALDALGQGLVESGAPWMVIGGIAIIAQITYPNIIPTKTSRLVRYKKQALAIGSNKRLDGVVPIGIYIAAQFAGLLPCAIL